MSRPAIEGKAPVNFVRWLSALTVSQDRSSDRGAVFPAPANSRSVGEPHKIGARDGYELERPLYTRLACGTIAK